MNSNCTACYDPDLDRLAYQSKLTLSKLSSELVKAIEFGYSCDKNAQNKIDTLQRLLNVVEKEARNLNLGGESCLTPFKKQALAEKIRKLTASCNIDKRIDVSVDKSKEDSWITENPFCVSREKWEKIAYRVCKAFTIDINIVSDTDKFDQCEGCKLDVNVLSIEEACDLTFEITRNLIPCDVIVAISVYENVCDHKLTITRTEEECDVDFDLLVTEHNCNIDFDLYKTLIECNVSFDIIKTVYANGCTFEVEGGQVLIASALNKYPVNKLNFTGSIDPQEIKKLGINTSNSEYLKNPKLFIEKLKSDYGK